MLKTKLQTALIISLSILLGAGINNFAFSDSVAQNSRIAVVDVAKVLESSSQVADLKKQQEAKKAEMVKWLNIVKADIQKQQTAKGKETLTKKYDAELAKKQKANREEYAKKLTAIDNNISNAISQLAQTKGYGVVLTKSSVLYGGDDLTAEISKMVK